MKEIVCATCKFVYKNEIDFLTNGSRFRLCSYRHLWWECKCRSSMMQPKGESDWFHPEQLMSKQAKSIFARIVKISSIPLIPSEIAQVIAVVSNDESSSKDIEKQIKSLPSLAINVLELANSYKTSSGQKIAKLEHAITYIGRHTLQSLIESAALKGYPFGTKKYTHEIFWRESRVMGEVAEFLSKKYAKHLEQDHIYLSASLCNVGKVIGAICFPEQIDAIYSLVEDPKNLMSWAEAEKKVGAFSHTVLGEITSTLWGFPDYILTSARFHHHMASDVPFEPIKALLLFDEDENNIPSSFEEKPLSAHDVVSLANQLAHWVLLQPHRMDDKIIASYSQRLGISFKEFDQLGQEIVSLVRAS